MRSSLLPLLCLLVITGRARSQYLPDSTQRKIDAIFERWNQPGSPGCAVGIVRNDTLLFAKGYGMANLEYDVPITPASIFHVASVSKQFTGYAMVLLARQGKLGLDDDVRRYLPWFPDLGATITIRHLLNHTSGIRDQWQLLATAGTRLDDVITQEQIIKVLSRQRALNSPPGERYNYCNSGYTMMAEIVKSITGQTLRQFMDSAVFRPLDMEDTHFHDEYAEVVKNRAYSYRREGGNGFANVALSYSNTGATSLFTTVNDLARWTMNFYTPKAGDEKDITQLTEKGKLNNGRVIDYALGIGNSTYRGWQQLGHSGADAGFRTIILVYPELKMGFIVLANLGDLNPGARAEKLMEMFVPDKKPKKAPGAKPDSSGAVLANADAVKKFEGNYISDEGTRIQFRLRNNKLYADAYGRSDLLKAEKGTFSTLGAPGVKFVFNIPRSGDTTVFVTYAPGETALLRKYGAVPETDAFLQAYAGKYYCPELDCSYGFAVKDNKLVLTSSKYEDSPLKFEGPDHLLSDHWWMEHLRVIRNAGGEITGFEVNDGRVLGLKFVKM
jgi:CubicO group peptidase (beta-lactamase class C family)